METIPIRKLVMYDEDSVAKIICDVELLKYERVHSKYMPGCIWTPIVSELSLHKRLVGFSSLLDPGSENEENVVQNSSEDLEFHIQIPWQLGIFKPINHLILDFSSRSSPHNVTVKTNEVSITNPIVITSMKTMISYKKEKKL